MQYPNHFRFLRRPEAQDLTGDKETAFNEKVKEGVLPPPVKLGPRAVGWIDYEMNAIQAAKAAGKSVAFIKALVRHLVDHRKKALSSIHIPYSDEDGSAIEQKIERMLREEQ